jgi:hypothetical protein
VTMLTVTINGRAYGPRDVRDDLSMNDFLREYERLAKQPVARADLEKTIVEALERPPVPLQRLRQIPRGRARRDPGGPATLSLGRRRMAPRSENCEATWNEPCLSG